MSLYTFHQPAERKVVRLLMVVLWTDLGENNRTTSQSELPIQLPYRIAATSSCMILEVLSTAKDPLRTEACQLVAGAVVRLPTRCPARLQTRHKRWKRLPRCPGSMICTKSSMKSRKLWHRTRYRNNTAMSRRVSLLALFCQRRRLGKQHQPLFHSTALSHWLKVRLVCPCQE